MKEPDLPQTTTPETAFTAFRSFVSQFDPLELLSQLTLTCLFAPESFISESHEMHRWARWIEFTAGYLAIQPFVANGKAPFDGSQIEEFEKIVSAYFDSFLLHFIREQETSEEERRTKRVLRSAQIYTLWVRGDAYPHQYFEYALELYSPHDRWFQKNLGFTIRDAIQIVRSLVDELNHRFNDSLKNAKHESVQAAEKYLGTEEAKGLTREELEARITCQLHFGAAKSLMRFTQEDVRSASNVSTAVCEAFLSRMSQTFGYRNPQFPVTFTDPENAPWDYNTVEQRPLFNQDDGYWFFTNPMLASVMFHTFYFDLMADLAYRPKFTKERGDFVERKVVQYMTRIFPERMVLLNPAKPGGEEFSDVAVLHDGKVIIFQCKAKGMRRETRTGTDFLKLREDMHAAIREAFDQAVRGRQFIRDSQVPKLRIGGIELVIDGSAITNVYLINVTLMPFLTLATRFENIEEALGLFPEKEYPFSVSLGDLDVLTQLLTSPARFLHYVNRRLTVEKTTFGVHADEIDLLGFYQSQGMIFNIDDFLQMNEVSLSGFSDEIDEFIYRKYEAKENPKLPSPPSTIGFEALIDGIESLHNMYRTDCAISLLNMNGISREKVVQLIEQTKGATHADGKGHSISMGSPEASTGVSFITAVGKNTDEAIYEQAYAFAILKKYAEKCEEWVGLGWHKDSQKIVDVAIFLKFPWEENEQMNHFVKEFLKPGKRIE